jgi:hypothetical protein
MEARIGIERGSFAVPSLTHSVSRLIVIRKTPALPGRLPQFDGSGNGLSGRDSREMISDELPLLREVEERAGERRRVIFLRTPLFHPLQNCFGGQAGSLSASRHAGRGERDEV